MISQELLDLLVCPENKTVVTLIDDAAVTKLNEAISAGSVTNRAGDAVEDPVDGGLLREDQAYLYIIRDDIPVMLVDEAIPYDAFK
ncbi:MAG: hypothetical protein VCC01_04990 [Candidatus Hydrogenedentota bacterium]